MSQTKTYTVILAYGEDEGEPGDTYLAVVEAETPARAIGKAQAEMAHVNDEEEVPDYPLVYCHEGQPIECEINWRDLATEQEREEAAEAELALRYAADGD